MAKELWLSRDSKRGGGYYNIHEGDEPCADTAGIFHIYLVCYCPKIFHHLVEGARLRKGRKKPIKRILIELED